MKVRNQSPRAWKRVLLPRIDLGWGLLAAAVWTCQVLRLHDPSLSFPFLVLGRGWIVLLGAAFLYHLASSSKGFSWLGFFPLLWLALSRFQWGICAGRDDRYWWWLVLFLAGEAVILLFPRGKPLLAFLLPWWGGLSWIHPGSSILPLGFLPIARYRFKDQAWVAWGGLAAVPLFFVLWRGWMGLQFDPDGLLDLMLARGGLVFFLLGWLGFLSMPKKGTVRGALSPFFWMTLGCAVWPDPLWDQVRLQILPWVLVFFAGFGWESFRRDLMDPSWHGRALWAALGICLFWGVR